MTRRRIRIASPIEPSGASWLLNCLLELGIEVHHRPVERNVWRAEGKMWVRAGDGLRLHPRAAILAKWMPALGRAEPFVFRPDVFVEYVQEPPSAGEDEAGTLLFVRDPRDAIWSAYRRKSPEMAFDAWIDVLHPRSLLDRARHWAFFVGAWRSRPGVTTLRFEDYKRDARATLEAALDHVGLRAEPDDITRALAASTFEKAREGEERYRAQHPNDVEVANRSGAVGDFRDRVEIASAVRRIGERAGDVLSPLGYGEGGPAAEGDGHGLASRLDWYANVALSPELASAAASRDPSRDPRLADALAFARRLDAEDLMRARLTIRDARELVESLEALFVGKEGHLRDRLMTARAALSDGGALHAQQLRAMLEARRAASSALVAAPRNEPAKATTSAPEPRFQPAASAVEGATN